MKEFHYTADTVQPGARSLRDRLLNLRHLCHVAVVVLAVIGAVIEVALRHWQPSIQKLGSEQQIESAPKLTAHRTVQDEIDGRVDQRQDIHQVT